MRSGYTNRRQRTGNIKQGDGNLVTVKAFKYLFTGEFAEGKPIND